MEALMQLVVPELDGGLFKPLYNTMYDNVGNFTEQTDFEFRVDTVGGLLHELRNETEIGVTLNATYGLNTTFVDVGKPLLVWYLGRLRSQIPLFVTACLLWLLLLACLIGVHRLLGHKRSRQLRRNRRSLAGFGANQKRLKPLFGLLTAITLLIVIGGVLAILHWSGRARFSGMSEMDGNDTSATTDRSHLTATFWRSVDEFDKFVELSIVDTNVTVLSVCKDELPNVLKVLETIATYLLDRLAGDFKLTPLLASFDEFIDLVKLLVDSMRAIKESRSGVVEPLAEFTTLIDSVRRDIAKQVTDACQNAGTSSTAPPADLCDRIGQGLTRLAVGIDHRQLDSDSSVTIVTLLEKMLKLNFSQVEDQVGSAKGQLYGSLDLVKGEVRKLFDQLVVTVSGKFEDALVDARVFRSDMQGAKRDRGFLIAMESIDRSVLGLDISVAIGSFAFVVVLCLAMFVTIRYLLSFRHAGGGHSDGGDGTDEVDLVYIGNGRGQPVASKKFLNGTDLLAGDALVVSSPRQSAREPRDWHSTCLFASCLLVLAALIYASLVFYAGAEAHMDACRYLTTESGVAKLDQFIGRLIEDKLWPQIETLLDREVKIPLGITRDKLPGQLIGPILNRCDNDSATIFQVLQLGGLLNVSQVLHSSMIQKELSKGSDMIQGLVRDLNTSNLIPPEVDDLLQKTLPSFAAVIDAENFASSISELRKPLLLLVGSQLPNLRSDLGNLEASLLRANSTDRRAVLIRHFSDQADELIDKWNGTLSSKLHNLLGHYNILQSNRRLTNLTLSLTVNAMELKAALSDKRHLLQSISARYNETLDRHMSAIVNLVTEIVERLQEKVGRCGPLRDIFQIPVGWCQKQIEPLPYTGLYMIASCMAFYILVLLLLTLMYLIRRSSVVGQQRR